VILLLSLPWVLRLGVMPAVLVVFALGAAYLSATEAMVAGTLIALLGIAPVAARWLAMETSFAETPAEDVYHLERGGLEASAAAEQVKKRALDKRAVFEELFALGRYELRRGQLDLALDHLQQAAGKRTAYPRLLTNLGNAMFAKGDLEGAAESYVAAGSLDPSFAPSFFNLGVLYTRKAASLPPEAAASEVQKAQSALDTVLRLQPSLLRSDLTQETLANRALISPPLPMADLLSLTGAAESELRVQSQLSAQLLGNLDSSLSWAFPLAAVGVLGLIGAVLRKTRASKACGRCGRPVCRRCDPELSRGSVLCQQCVNVFARKNVVGPPVKIRKQIEVAQFRLRIERLSYLFGVLCSGAGHVFSGLPVRGTVHAFIFLFILSNIVFRRGVIRYPYGIEPLFMRLTPLGIALVAVYLLSLRGLYKQQP
jgi:tetratricopeptide (TPR) repeat protein